MTYKSYRANQKILIDFFYILLNECKRQEFQELYNKIASIKDRLQGEDEDEET